MLKINKPIMAEVILQEDYDDFSAGDSVKYPKTEAGELCKSQVVDRKKMPPVAKLAVRKSVSEVIEEAKKKAFAEGKAQGIKETKKSK